MVLTLDQIQSSISVAHGCTFVNAMRRLVSVIRCEGKAVIGAFVSTLWDFVDE